MVRSEHSKSRYYQHKINNLRNIFRQTNTICHIFLFNKSRCAFKQTNTFYMGGGGGGGYMYMFVGTMEIFHQTDLPILIVYPLSGVGGGGGLLPFTPKNYQEFQAPQKIKIFEILSPHIRKDPIMHGNDP